MPLNPVIQAWVGARDQAIRMYDEMQDRALKQKQLTQQNEQFKQGQQLAIKRIAQEADLANKRNALIKAELTMKAQEMAPKGLLQVQRQFDMSPEAVEETNRNLPTMMLPGQQPQAIGATTEVPGLGTIPVQTPEDYFSQGIAPTLNIKSKGAMDLARARAQETMNLEKFRLGGRKALQEDQQAFTADQKDKDRLANKIRSDATNATRMAAARLRQSGESADFNIEPYTQGAADGTVTVGDISKIPSKKVALHITAALSQNGIRPITDAQRSWLDDYKATISTIPLMDQFLDIAPKTNTRVEALVGGIAAIPDKNIAILSSELAGRGSILARVMMREKGNMSNQDITRAQRAYIPSAYDAISANIQRRNTFVRDVNALFDSKFPGISKQQRELLKERVGLNKIPLEYKSTPKIPDEILSQIPNGTTKKLTSPSGQSFTVTKSATGEVSYGR